MDETAEQCSNAQRSSADVFNCYLLSNHKFLSLPSEQHEKRTVCWLNFMCQLV